MWQGRRQGKLPPARARLSEPQQITATRPEPVCGVFGGGPSGKAAHQTRPLQVAGQVGRDSDSSAHQNMRHDWPITTPGTNSPPTLVTNEAGGWDEQQILCFPDRCPVQGASIYVGRARWHAFHRISRGRQGCCLAGSPGSWHLATSWHRLTWDVRHARTTLFYDPTVPVLQVDRPQRKHLRFSFCLDCNLEICKSQNPPAG